MLLTKLKRIYLLSVLCLTCTHILGQNTSFSSEDELLAKASLLFENKNFEEAEPLYSQLLSLYPKDSEYNYKYGTCLLMAGNDREQALDYIQYAISKGGVEDEVYFYLGKAYHKNYEFDKAIDAYRKYKERVPSAAEKEYDVDHHIQMCENGRKLLKKIKGLNVLQVQDMSFENFYRIYELEGLKGQLLAKPEKFMSKYDKKVNAKSIMFFSENAKELYFTSYGDKGENGKDIYKVVLINKGKWSDPINLGPVINTPLDEDFVFVHPETDVMYFSSNGHTSMGGYDIFKSTYDAEIADWTEVENLDFPYSTVDNDYMYVSSPDNPIAFFASDRFKSAGKTSVYKVNTVEVAPDIAVIKGKLSVEGIPEIQNATITVKDEEGNLISRVETQRNSTYELAFGQNGGSYVFNIETTKDSPIHSGKISLPEDDGLNVYTQELILGGSLENQSLTIKNDFENATATTVEELSLPPELLKEQSNLTVNSSEEGLAVSETESATESSGDVSKEQLDPIAQLKTKEEISAEFNRIKEKNTSILKQNKAAQNIAFNNAREYQKKAKSLIQEMDEQGSSQNSAELKDSAAYFSSKAQAFVEIASALEKNAEDLQYRQHAIEQVDVEISHLLLINEIEQAEKKLLAIQADTDAEKNPELIQQDDLGNSNSQNSISKIELKINSTLEERKEIEEKIAQLQDEKAKSNRKRAEEIEVSLKSYSLDVQDLNYRLEKLKEEKNRTEQLHSAGNLKEESWNEVETALSHNGQVPEVSEVERSRIENEMLALQNRQQIKANNASSKQTDDESKQTVQQSESTNTDFSTEAEAQWPNNQEAVPAGDDGEVFADNAVLEEDKAIEIEETELSQTDSTIYSLPAARELLSEAKNLSSRSEQKFAQYQQILTSIKSLPTEEQRIKAFERAHQIQDEARVLELEAAIVYGNANKIQYLRNTARFRSLSEASSRNVNTNMILLLSDEADIYYQQAEVLREELDSADRFSKKESNYTEALELEKKALKKQEQALSLLHKQEDQELLTPLNFEEKKKLASDSAAKLQEEYAELLRKIETTRIHAKRSQNVQEKDSLLQIAEEMEHAAGEKVILANIFYIKSLKDESGEITSVDKSDPQLVNIASVPEKLDSSQLDMVDENVKQEIINSSEFREYQEVYEHKEDLVNKTFVVFQRSQDLVAKRDSLQHKETQLRSSALDAPTDSQKVRLIKEALVLNEEISSLNSSLDSAGKIIKLRNYLIRSQSQVLEEKLENMENEERAKQIMLLAKVVYAENQGADETLADVDNSATEQQQPAEITEQTEEESPNEEPTVSEIVEDPKDVEDTESIAEQIEEREGVERAEKNEGQLEGVQQEEAIQFIPDVIKEDHFMVKENNRSSYSTSNPIPINPDYPEGIVYQVQVGAFRNPIPQDHFQGFAPLMGVTGENGITRYTAGLFNDFQHADQAKDQIRALGYKDAFVVAFLNGQKIPLSQARQRQIEGGVESQSRSTIRGISINKPTQREAELESFAQELNNPELAEVTLSNTIEGTYFSIQVGVFSKPLKKGELAYEGLLIVDKLESGLYRYHIGIFDDLESAKLAEESSISKEISDSFVVAYHKGKRISISQAIAILSNQ